MGDIIKPPEVEFKEFEQGLNLSCGLIMVGSAKNCIKCYKI